MHGGNATPCGRWWVLVDPDTSWTQYQKDYAVCPEFNTGEFIQRCVIRANEAVIAGLGQTMTCPQGKNTIIPSTVLLQALIDQNQTSCGSNLTCVNCSANWEMLSSSTCIAGGSDSGSTPAAPLPPGAIAGIVIGAVVMLGGAAALARCILRPKNARSDSFVERATRLLSPRSAAISSSPQHWAPAIRPRSIPASDSAVAMLQDARGA